MSKKKIGIIFGHGDNDPGAVSEFGNEAEFVRELQPFILEQLAKYSGIETIIFDTNRNWYKYLGNNSYNFKGYDYILEIHANSGVHDPNGNGATTGTETWVTNSNQVARAKIINDAVASVGFKNRGVKTESFRVIRIINNQGVDASLLEVCFVGDKDDIDVFNANKKRIGVSIADALAKVVGIAINESPSIPTPPKPVEQAKETIVSRWSEKGQFIADVPEGGVYIRKSPNFTDKDTSMYYNGELCPAKDQYYVECIKTTKYLYIKYKRKNGSWGYVPVREMNPDGSYGKKFGKCF